MDTVVGARQESGAAIILNRVLLTVEVSHEGDGVVDAWGEWEELLLEVTSGALVVEVSNRTDEFASRQLVTAEVVSEEFSCISLCDVKLSAHTILLPEGAASGLEFGNLIPDSRVSDSGKIGGWCRELALACRCHIHGGEEC